MLDFGGDFNKSSFLFWLLEFTAVGFFTVGIEPFAAEKICKKNAQKIRIFASHVHLMHLW